MSNRSKAVFLTVALSLLAGCAPVPDAEGNAEYTKGYNQMPKRLLILVRLDDTFAGKSPVPSANPRESDFQSNLERELNGCGVSTVYKNIPENAFPESEKDTLKTMNADAYLLIYQQSFGTDHGEVSRMSYAATVTDVKTGISVWRATVTLNHLEGNPGFMLSDTLTSMMSGVDLIPTHCLVSSNLQQLMAKAHPH